jgi:hypothetical protein
MSKYSKPIHRRSEQSQAFIEAARKLGCDEDPAHFDEILKKVARHKPPSGRQKNPKTVRKETD